MKVRPKKDLQGYDKDIPIDLDYTKSFVISAEDLVKYGLLEEVKEPQTLEEKIRQCFCNNHQKHESANKWRETCISEIADLVREHNLERFEEILKEVPSENIIVSENRPHDWSIKISYLRTGLCREEK